MTPASSQEQDTEVAPVIERNISAVLAHRQQHDRQRSRQERLADAIGRFAGSLASIYVHLVLFGSPSTSGGRRSIVSTRPS
jgi:uncharacterized membrane protein